MVTVVGMSWRTIMCQLQKGLMMMIKDSGFDIDKNERVRCLNIVVSVAGIATISWRAVKPRRV